MAPAAFGGFLVGRLVAVEVREERRGALSGEDLLDLRRPPPGGREVPVRREPAMDHGPADPLVVMKEGTPAEPVEQPFPVRRLEHRAEGVGGGAGPGPLRDREKMQVMVAENALRAHPHRPAQHPERVRPAVHEIAREPDAVRPGVRVEQLQERIESLEAPLDVTDDPGGHGSARKSQGLSSRGRRDGAVAGRTDRKTLRA